MAYKIFKFITLKIAALNLHYVPRCECYLCCMQTGRLLARTKCLFEQLLNKVAK